MKNIFIKVIMICTTITFMQCNEIFDKDPVGQVGQETVWNDLALAEAFVNIVYRRNLPAWPTNSSNTDNSNGGENLLYGRLTVDNIDQWNYTAIREINVGLRDLSSGSLTAEQQDQIAGQLLFFRAWLYFDMVKLYGGIPLILTPQERSEDLLVARAKTSVVITQIVTDLNDAATKLPVVWPSGADLGRITKGAALALKGRVLLHYASEQFNPTMDASRWETAYTANKEAVDFLETNGSGLHSDFGRIFFDEDNPEVILSTKYLNPGRTHNNDACSRPLDFAQNCTGRNHPTLQLADAFPMKNGLPITDLASGYDATAFWVNRDPRFDATIVYNGAPWALAGISDHLQFTYVGFGCCGPPAGGYFERKGLKAEFQDFETEISDTDWIEIRFAEVLLNMAEAANETGRSAETYTALRRIRDRAGIESGVGNTYGIADGLDISALRDVVMNERRIEFAFEGKRAEDLRRRRMYSQLNNTRRTGLRISFLGANENAFISDVKLGNIDLTTDYTTYFNNEVIDLDTEQAIDYPDNNYFFAIPQRHIELNSNLEQTSGWPGGTFDPLQ